MKDRLASYIHCKVRDTFDQAVQVALRQTDRVNLEELRKWCEREGFPDTFREFVEALKAEKGYD